MSIIEEIKNSIKEEAIELIQKYNEIVKSECEERKNTKSILEEKAKLFFSKLGNEFSITAQDRYEWEIGCFHPLLAKYFDKYFFVVDLSNRKWEYRPMTLDSREEKALEILNLRNTISNTLVDIIPNIDSFYDECNSTIKECAMACSMFFVAQRGAAEELDKLVEIAVSSYVYEKGISLDEVPEYECSRKNAHPILKKIAIKNVYVDYLDDSNEVCFTREIPKKDFYNSIFWTVKRTLEKEVK